jgi:hypothetical protein
MERCVAADAGQTKLAACGQSDQNRQREAPDMQPGQQGAGQAGVDSKAANQPAINADGRRSFAIATPAAALLFLFAKIVPAFLRAARSRSAAGLMPPRPPEQRQ